MQTSTYIGHLLVIIWNILKELLNFIFLYKIFAFYNHFPFLKFTYIIHKAKENNNCTNKISMEFLFRFNLSSWSEFLFYISMYVWCLQNSESHEASGNTLMHFGDGGALRSWKLIQEGCAMSPAPATFIRGSVGLGCALGNGNDGEATVRKDRTPESECL